jgi:hypothetical protein
MSLQKNKIYNWNMGAVTLHVKHIGLDTENPGLICGSSVGTPACLIFKFTQSGRFIALSYAAFYRWCSKADDLIDCEKIGELWRYVILYSTGDIFKSDVKYKTRQSASYQAERYLGNIDGISARNKK